MPTPDETQNAWNLANKLYHKCIYDQTAPTTLLYDWGIPIIVEHVRAELVARDAQWLEWAIPAYANGYICRGCSEVDDTRDGIDHLDGCKVAALLKGQ